MLKKLGTLSQSARRLVGMAVGIVLGLVVIAAGSVIFPSLTADDLLAYQQIDVRPITPEPAVTTSRVRSGIVARGSDGDIPYPDESLQSQNALTTSETSVAAPNETPEIQAPIQPSESHISIILTDLGINKAQTNDILSQAPSHFALAFSPYANDVSSLMMRAQGRGHTVLLQWPMEPENYPHDDPGPLAMLSGLPIEENIARLNQLLNKIGALDAGLITFMGDAFVTEQEMMDTLLPVAAPRVTMILDNQTGADSLLPTLSRMNDIPYMRVDRSLDTQLTPSAISRSLESSIGIARQMGHAILITRPYPIVMEKIGNWMKDLPEDIKLVPLHQGL